MDAHLMTALIFAVLAVPAFVSARWLSQGRLPLAGDSRMTVRDQAVLDSRLARLMRMIGVAMLMTALGVGMFGHDERRMSALVIVMVVVIHLLIAAFIWTVISSKRRARGGGG